MIITIKNSIFVSQRVAQRVSLNPWALSCSATEYSTPLTRYVLPSFLCCVSNLILAQINMLEKNGTCQTLCVVPDVPAEDAKFINDRIREDYALNWLVDGLPAAEMKQDLKTGDIFFDMGFNLGDDDGAYAETPALHNHHEIVFQ
jgi:hypothetical protein